jgi:deferrochelatase/peroxidase EfeB
MGFKDGTKNIKLEDEDSLRDFVWVGQDDRPEWLRGGSYVVTRRIRMLIEVWDRATLLDQEQTIGRTKIAGAPLGETEEFDPIQLAKKDSSGDPIIPMDAHIRLASPTEHGGTKILRRGYSFTDGMDTRLGQLDAGLFFISYQRDPKQFITLQDKLARLDALNEYITHTGSAVFACPPGPRPGSPVGAGLLV